MQWTFKTALTIIVLDLIMVNFSFSQKPVYLDSSQPIEKRVDDLLSRMTLEEKLGQLNMPYHGMMAKGLPAKIDAVRKFAAGEISTQYRTCRRVLGTDTHVQRRTRDAG